MKFLKRLEKVEQNSQKGTKRKTIAQHSSYLGSLMYQVLHAYQKCQEKDTSLMQK